MKYYVCKIGNTWWRHQIETSSALLVICAGSSPVPVNSPHKGQWRWALMFFFISAWINGWANNREAGDLRRNRAHYDVIVMKTDVNHRMSSIHILYQTVAQAFNAYSIVNSSLPGQNGRHFTDVILKCIFMNEEFCVLIRISFKFVPKGSIENKSALVQVMACHVFSTKPLPEPMHMKIVSAKWCPFCLRLHVLI